MLLCVSHLLRPAANSEHRHAAQQRAAKGRTRGKDDCSCVQGISATLCEENIMFWEVSGTGTEVILPRVISFSDRTL